MNCLAVEKYLVARAASMNQTWRAAHNTTFPSMLSWLVFFFLFIAVNHFMLINSLKLATCRYKPFKLSRPILMSAPAASAIRSIGRIDKISVEVESSDSKKSLLLSPDKSEIVSNDPFILFAEDWFKLPSGGFPSHPHSGFQTLTFVLEGSVEHKDSTGSGGILYPGDIQVMVAGRGVIHSELATSSKAFSHTLQLWLNLPKKYKKIAPGYQDLRAENIPLYKDSENSAEIRVIAGDYKGITGTATNYVEMLMLQPKFTAKKKKFSVEIPDNKAGFIYLIEGQINFLGANNSSTTAQAPAVIKLPQISEKSETKSVLSVETVSDSVNFLFAVGNRLNEPVFSYGPFISTGQEEMQQIFQDYQQGKFNQKLGQQ
jgi:redox-sensitive bicupin YhaK (pirin superfamily)